MSNWRKISEAPRGTGPLLLRAGAGLTEPAYVGYQDPDNGRWLSGDVEVHPTHWCPIPEFDCDEAAS
jgi:hypothetical protein